MRFLEELSMNALPSLQTILFDGWVIRFADGYSNRANSVNPIYPIQNDIREKIKGCEKLFKDRGLKPVYKITPFVCPENLDDVLLGQRYKIIHLTSVQTMCLEKIAESYNTSVQIEYEVSDTWFNKYCQLSALSTEKAHIFRRMLNCLIPFHFCASFLLGDQTIACGLGVLENGYLGLFDITVDVNYRNRGYGMELIKNLLSVGKSHGAKQAYLQVMLNNQPALHLYKKMGFAEQYKYHYRVLTV